VNEKRTAQRRLFHGHGLFALFICIAAAGSILSGTLLALFRPEASTKVSERTPTFPERVAYQRAIEDVYWRHRIWPKENPDPKPSLDAVISQAQLEKKVEDYLLKSQTLEDTWQQPITAEQLQVEMDRMAQHTRQPDVLRELFSALRNDPFIIAECLARPALSGRLVTNLSARGQQPLDSLGARADKQTASVLGARSPNYTLPKISDVPNACIDDTWTATSTTNAPEARFDHTAVWTGSEMIVWGGAHGFDNLNTGGRYDPSTDNWTATSTTNAPAAQSVHTAVWTGSEMIIFGAGSSGGKYNPMTDSWTATSTTNAPSERGGHTAIWTGSEMIVWGGAAATFFNDGGRYNPGTDSWMATSTTNAPVAREYHRAVWTGSEMIVWGGYNGNTAGLNTGGRYDPSADSWTATSITNAPHARFYHTAVWSGSEMIVWGGFAGTNTGGRYSAGTDSWTATTTTGAPTARYLHTAVWMGSEMIIWGGFASNTGGRYDPDTDSWTATSTSNAPALRVSHTAVWTGSEMIVWGGQVANSVQQPSRLPLAARTPPPVTNTGGRYCAQSGPTPTATPTSTATPTPTSTTTPRPSPTPRPALTPRPRPTPPPRP
jgi:N-acetylneuraminic acid mutarotase